MLKEYLDQYFQDKELNHIFKDVIGTDDPLKIEKELERVISLYFGSKLGSLLFIQSSIGVVFGLLLNNKQQVILKVYSPKIPKLYLEKMNSFQTVFYKEQFPTPEVLSPIFPFLNTFAGFYALIEGEKADPHQAPIRNALAQSLARFSEIVDKHQLPALENFFQLAQGKRLWPVPHNVLFDLKRSARGAGWIARKAIDARKRLNTIRLEKKLAHTDWGIKNALFNKEKLVGIFDWDSLGAMSEPEMVGRACAQFTADWESGFKITPSVEEARNFVAAYEQCRRKKFSLEEYKVVSAAADSLIAIIARFEHAGGGSNHPYQDLLKKCGEKSFLLRN